MLKALLKVRIKALLSASVSRGSKKKTSGLKKIGFGALMLYCGIAFLSLFCMIFSQMVEPLSQMGLAWFYFASAGFMAFCLMVVGSVFATKNQLYDAKDNELLLAMPIPSSVILASRMLFLYILNLFFELLVLGPAGAMYVIMGNSVTAVQVVFYLVVALVLPLLSLSVSSLLGALIAFIAARMQHKALVNTALYIVFFALYMYACMSMQTLIGKLVQAALGLAEGMRASLPPLYWLGDALANGNAASFAGIVLCCVVPFIVVYIVLSATFINIMTTRKGGAKRKYVRREMHTRSPFGALFAREMQHMLQSTPYLLNCCIGVVMMAIMAVGLLIKKDLLQQIFTELFSMGHITLISAAILGMLASMCTISAPSVSLEGKRLWVVRTMPVTAKQVLLSKAALHLVMTVPVSLLAALSVSSALSLGTAGAAMMMLFVTVVNLLCAFGGLMMNLLFPRLDWMNETVPVKQGASVFLSMMVPPVVMLMMGFAYIKWLTAVAPLSYLAICTGIFALLAFGAYTWDMKKGTRVFETL